MAKCRVCREPFKKLSTSHKDCSIKCAIKGVEIDKAKQERKALLAAKVKARSRGEWLKLAQSVINKYVRLRDKDCGCISCDRGSSWQGQWHASHFKSVGAASAIRFNLWNINKSCSICNNWKSGNLSEYEPRLRLKIGDKKVDWLKSQTQPVKYDVEYLKKLIKVFQKRIKSLTRKKKGGRGGNKSA